MAEFIFRTAKEFSVVTVRISKENESRMNGLLAQGKCLGCEEKHIDGERVTRGLCARCYQGTMQAIRLGKTTEEDRLREGRLLESRPGRRPSSQYLRNLMGVAS